jgi:hypothetical protein
MRLIASLMLVLLLATPSIAATPTGTPQGTTRGTPPGPLIETWNYAFVPDAHFVWHGPQAAAGVLVWAHGKAGNGTDLRAVPAPPYVRVFNDAGWDVVRFNRAPAADTTERASSWLHDGLKEVRAMGWRAVIAAGDSRGGWNDLMLLDTPGLADVIIAVSPAAQGSGESLELGAQTDDLRAMLDDIPRQNTRVAFVQFDHDFFIGSADTRSRMMVRLVQPKVGALLLLDRPPGFSGHGAAYSPNFAPAYGACLLAFATAPTPPGRCAPAVVSDTGSSAAPTHAPARASVPFWTRSDNNEWK